MATYKADDQLAGGKLPYPGETFNGMTVIASCWGNDDPETEDGKGGFIPIWYGLLVLDPSPVEDGPHYHVFEVTPGEGIYLDSPFYNIIPATNYYDENIAGGY